MRTGLFVCLLAAGLIAAPSQAFAQAAAIKTEVLTDWNNLKDTMMKIAAEMPEDKFAFKPTPAQRNYGEHILHVAGANFNFLKAFGGKAQPAAFNPKATAKAEILKALSDSFDYGTALIQEQTEESILTKVKAAFLGEATKVRIVYFLIGHTWDTSGQLAVYLRLNGLVPPASQRP
jgi:uncharacterized damage-inducible protein DinB